jgi:hypothetical protein
MNTGSASPLTGFAANEPVNTPVLARPSSWREMSDLALVSLR